MLYVHNELVYDANITHNLNTMADKAGIYYHLGDLKKLILNLPAN